MIHLCFMLLLAQTASREKAIVEGSIVNAVTNEPLKKARVTLSDGNIGLEVVSGDRGKFRFEGIEPEVYQIMAERPGFLAAVNEGWMEITAGEHVEDVIIKMTPQSAIAGHVVDEDGDPVPGARVLVEHKIHANSRTIVLYREEKVADEEGYFFAGALPAGRYSLTLTPPERDPSKPGRPGPEEYFVRTEDPIPVEVATGATTRNVEARIRRGRVFRIRGRVSNWPHPGIPVQLMPTGSWARIDKDNAFAFQDVAPGSYLINASSRLGCPVPVTVSDHDVDGLAVEFTPGPTVAGRIKMEGEGHLQTEPVIELQIGAGGPISTIGAKADGTFEATNLKPDKYTVDYTAPDGFYVKSIQFNHQPSRDHVIDLASCTGGTLDIAVAPNAATVSAKVRDAKNVKVTLWSDSVSKSREAEDGTVTFKNLAPGEYRILAWEQVDDKYVEIPEFRSSFDAQNISVSEGSHETIELRIISKSTSDAEVAKLQ
jgi:hypothetical protein